MLLVELRTALHYFTGTPIWHSLQTDLAHEYLPFYKESPFSRLGIYVCVSKSIPLPNKMTTHLMLPEDFPTESDMDDSASPNTHANPCFSLAFLRYLIVQVFPFGGMMNHSLILLNNYSIEDDTNAASESWNKVSLMKYLTSTTRKYSLLCPLLLNTT